MAKFLQYNIDNIYSVSHEQMEKLKEFNDIYLTSDQKRMLEILRKSLNSIKVDYKEANKSRKLKESLKKAKESLKDLNKRSK